MNDLREGILGEFAERASFAVDTVQMGELHGFHRHAHAGLSMVRSTTKEFLTEEQKRCRRQALETARRAYKTEMQRLYRKKKAVVA